jgi:hypothetical protein
MAGIRRNTANFPGETIRGNQVDTLSFRPDTLSRPQQLS